LHDIWLVDSQENHKKIVATRCQILRLKCTKFDFGWAPPQTPLGSLQRSPRLPSWIWGPLCDRGRGWAGEEEGKGRGRGGRDKWRWGKGTTPKLLLNQGPSESCYAIGSTDEDSVLRSTQLCSRCAVNVERATSTTPQRRTLCCVISSPAEDWTIH